MINEAIILAGGLGTRLREAVPDLPKCMAPVAGRPFLFYVINYLRTQRIEKFIFSLGYKHEIIEKWLADQFAAEQKAPGECHRNHRNDLAAFDETNALRTEAIALRRHPVVVQVRKPALDVALDERVPGSLILPIVSYPSQLHLRLTVRYDRFLATYGGFFHLACALLVLRRVLK